MRQTKLFQLLSLLTPEEMKRFEQLVHSPFFSVHKDTIQFFDLIRPYYPNFHESDLNLTVIFNQIYPQQAYDDARVRILRMYLYKLLLKFLQQLELERDAVQGSRYLLEALFARNAEKHLPKLIDEHRSQLDKEPLNTSWNFLHKYDFGEFLMHYGEFYGSRWEGKDFYEAIEDLDSFYLTEKLKYCCYSYTYIEMFIKGEEKVPIPFMDEIIEYVSKNLEKVPPITALYFYSFMIVAKREEETHFDSLRSLLITHGKLLSRDEQINAYNVLLNYCIRNYRKGKQEYLGKMLPIYQYMLDNDLMFDEGALSSHHFKNIATLGLRLGEYDWTEHFIHTYKDKIDPQYRESVVNYNLGHFYIYKEEYGKALYHLQQVTFPDPFYRISHNMLMLKIYYEQQEIESFLALSVSFQTFLRRKGKLSEGQRDSYKNFTKYLKAIFMFRAEGKGTLKKIEQRITECVALIEKDWLLIKVKQLQEPELVEDKRVAIS